MSKPYQAIPYKWDGKILGGFSKGKSVELKDYTRFASVPYRQPATNIQNKVVDCRGKRTF